MTSNTNTQGRDYSAVLTLPASPETVIALFTSADGVSRWWGPTEGEATVGGTLITRFGDHGVNANRVREVGPNRIVWEPIAAPGTTPTGHTQEWLGTTIEIDIRPTDTDTELSFRHIGLTPALDCWDDCYNGWTYFMSSIETYANTGTGTPFGTHPGHADPIAGRKQSMPAPPDAVLRVLADPHRQPDPAPHPTQRTATMPSPNANTKLGGRADPFDAAGPTAHVGAGTPPRCQ